MIIPGSKKTVSTILSKMSPSGADGPSAAVAPEEDMGGSHAMQAIAEDIMTAVKGGSVSDLASALHALKDELSSDESDEQ